MAQEKLISRVELANKLGISQRTIRRWENAGCPVFKPSPRSIRFDFAQVVKWGMRQGKKSC